MKKLSSLTRRQVLKGSAVVLATSTLPFCKLYAAESSNGITAQLARYIVSARGNALPSNVALACKQHILDTLGAMLSGSRMRPGEMATKYVQQQGGTEQASVVGSTFRTNAVNAALANAMCAHSDETDDFEPVTKAHPGSSVVPAALAMAELHHSSGEEFMRAVALGYDTSCRLLMALGPDLVRGSHRSAEGTAATFGAVGAAASLAKLDEQNTRFALSYAAQQESGLWSWVKDHDHIEKAFDFAGMGARNGVQAVSMVESGMTGVDDVLDGTHNLLIALSSQPRPSEMIDRLGERFFVTETAIKTYSVGYPIQSPLDAILSLRKKHNLVPEQVKGIEVRVPSDAVGIVGDSAMPDVNCAHMVAIALVKGKVSFVDSHDTSLMKDPALMAQRAKIKVIADPALDDPKAPRGAKVIVTLADGKTVEHHTRFPSGTKENPLSTEAVNAKVRDLIVPVIGKERSEQLINQINNLEQMKDMAELRSLLIA
ncbi:MmgE/PrpD family protein [Pseudomonas sp. LS-2]|uniref:MmgE/PrpD family protein n=1 Tax=Pseudomonas sp. LS-2 TaxID=2315859 RepID=UPI000E7202FD|nr:MmgE/PrpD family protein [Pseudomonas sp. LS-2]RJX74859.1 MmgE/PrpD family protein [Pseudomonas sp. LS-2]